MRRSDLALGSVEVQAFWLVDWWRISLGDVGTRVRGW
jgi:hypothetical protein